MSEKGVCGNCMTNEAKWMCVECLRKYCSPSCRVESWKNGDCDCQDAIRAPVDGLVTHVDRSRGTITVYVSPEDSHEILSPVTGKVVGLDTVEGTWIRPGVFNVPDQTKTGRLVVKMETRRGRRMVEFWIEVGHGRYITDTVLFRPGVGDESESGRRVGEIVIGSLYEMHLDPDAEIVVGVNQRVRAGSTLLAFHTISESRF